LSRALRLFAIAMIGCLLQTNVLQHIRIADAAPDFMIAITVALTSFCGLSGIFCTAALMVLFYDASVGYVMALNPVFYILIALGAFALRAIFNEFLSKWKHKSFLIVMVISFSLTVFREIAYIGYLFLIGAKFNLVVFFRLFLSAGYTALITIPCLLFIRALLNWHPFKKKKVVDDFYDEFPYVRP